MVIKDNSQVYSYYFASPYAVYKNPIIQLCTFLVEYFRYTMQLI
jgi:hypothetical protein